MLLFIPARRVPPPLPSRVLHQKHERGGDAGQRGAGGFSGSREERLAAGAPQRHQHHVRAGPRGSGTPAHQQPQRRVRNIRERRHYSCHYYPSRVVKLYYVHQFTFQKTDD